VENDKDSRGVYAAWAAGFGALAALGLFCGLFLSPFVRVRAALAPLRPKSFGGITLPLTTSDFRHEARKALEHLGGPEAAARKLAMYLHAPKHLAPDRWCAALLLPKCGKHAVPALAGLLSDEDADLRSWAQRQLRIIEMVESAERKEREMLARKADG
jgi:hypothetical protein